MKLNIQPQSLGERWYQYIVNKSQTKFGIYMPLLLGIIFILFSFKIDSQDFRFLGVSLILISLVWLERNIAYKVLKRQQDEIKKLKKIKSQEID